MTGFPPLSRDKSPGQSVVGLTHPAVECLESFYLKYNKRSYVSPDPLQFLYAYPEIRDREIVALVASSLAYGRVRQILTSVRIVLDTIGNPFEFVIETGHTDIRNALGGFKHRFTTGDDIADLLIGISRAVQKYGSLEGCFLANYSESDENILAGLEGFVSELENLSGRELGQLLPHPGKGSACKRLNLFLRWMVRSDEVDPGGWYTIPPGKLLIPLDTHMHRICSSVGLSSRRQADMRTVIEVTDGFRRYNPKDPVKYDFSLTRLGIRDDEDPSGFIEQFCSLVKT